MNRGRLEDVLLSPEGSGTINGMSDERKNALTPNTDRSLDEKGQNPADVESLAINLLSDVTYALALTNNSTAQSLATLPTDVALMEDDLKAGEIMHTNAVVSSIGLGSSIITPLVKKIASRKEKGIRQGYERRSQLAARKRLQHIVSLQETKSCYLTYRITHPPLEGNPIDVHLNSRKSDNEGCHLALTPYQIQAAGVVELVRACGRLLGPCDGDALADRFMRLILILGGEGDHENLVWAETMVAGGFYDLAEQTELPAVPLSPLKRFKAETILAAWIRMSRLGLDLFRVDRLEQWHEYFDGTLYGACEVTLGEIWRETEENKSTMQRSDMWMTNDRPPWMIDHHGSPVLVVGIAGELLKMAIKKVQVSALAPDGFSLDNLDLKEETVQFDESEKTMLKLKDHHRAISGSTLGSIIAADLRP